MNLKFDHKFYYIYLTKNIITQKCYIGWHSSNSLDDGYVGSGIALKKSIKKYGEENFITGIIEFTDKKSVFEREKFWIEKIGTYKKGYNLTKGGDGGASKNHRGRPKGFKHSEKTKRKISLSESGKAVSEETRELMSLAKKNKLMNPDTVKKISDKNRGKKRSADQKRKISESLKGNPNLGKNLKNREKIKCQYCDRDIDIFMFSRFHGDKCKSKEI